MTNFLSLISLPSEAVVSDFTWVRLGLSKRIDPGFWHLLSRLGTPLRRRRPALTGRENGSRICPSDDTPNRR
jgi:hypothetical protein